jgi:drug/metabolite transporter (DMT)-like permease
MTHHPDQTPPSLEKNATATDQTKSPTPSPRRRFGTIDLLLFLMSTIWAVNFTVIKTSLEDFSPLSFNAIRFLIASITLFLIFRTHRPKFTIETEDLSSLITLGILANTVYQVAFIEGVARSRAGNAALILATTPMFVAVLSIVRGHEKLNARTVLGVLLSFIGIVFIVSSDAASIEFRSTLFGDILLLTATVCWSAYTIGLKRHIDRYGAMETTLVTMCAGTVPLVLISIPWLRAQAWSDVRATAWAGLVFSALGALVFCFVIWNYGVRRIGSTRTAAFSNLSPVIAVIAAWIGLNERPTKYQLVGMAVILLGIYLTRERENLEISAS